MGLIYAISVLVCVIASVYSNEVTSCQMNSSQPIFGCVKLSDDAGKHTGKIEDV